MMNPYIEVAVGLLKPSYPAITADTLQQALDGVGKVPEEKMLSRQEAAAYLNITPKMVKMLTLSGKLPVSRFGHRTVRYKQSDLNKALTTAATKGV